MSFIVAIYMDIFFSKGYKEVPKTSILILIYNSITPSLIEDLSMQIHLFQVLCRCCCLLLARCLFQHWS